MFGYRFRLFLANTIDQFQDMVIYHCDIEHFLNLHECLCYIFESLTFIDGTETCFYGLEDAIKELIDMENGNEFDIPHNSITHTILPNSSSSSSSLNCPLGTIPFIAYCGNYLV